MSKSKHDVLNLIHKNYNINWKDLFKYLRNHRKYDVKLIPGSTWKKNYLEKITPSNAIYPIFALYANCYDINWTRDLSNISQSDCLNTKDIISIHGITLKKVNKEFLDVHFNYLEKSEFLTHKKVYEGFLDIT